MGAFWNSVVLGEVGAVVATKDESSAQDSLIPKSESRIGTLAGVSLYSTCLFTGSWQLEATEKETYGIILDGGKIAR